jgi:ribokinase
MDAGVIHELRDRVAYVIPNEHELTQLGAPPDDVVVIETRGRDGVVIHDAGLDEHVPAPSVEAVDTTGAGDCFCGVFAAAIAEGRPLRASVERAVAAAAMSVTVAGAREGMPTREALDGWPEGRASGTDG